MVENDIILRDDECEGIAGVELPLKTIFLSPSIMQKYGPGVLLRGLSFHPQYRTDIKVNQGLRNFLLGQGAGLDLVAINLQRGRDHGLPDYKQVREFYGLSSISSFSDINSDEHVHNRLQKVYDNVNDIDLWAGIYSEPLVSGTSLPATAIAIVKAQFEALRDGDFYFYKNDPAISSSDLSLINSSGLANILRRNSSTRDIPQNIFFKEPCDDEDELEDLRDEGHPICTGHGATFFTSCSSSSGSDKGLGTHSGVSGVRKIKVNLGFGVRIHSNQGETFFYTDDTGCLPSELHNNISSIQVICLSDDDSTIDCSSFAGALFKDCFSSPLPIFTPGKYNTEQLKSLSVEDNKVKAIRVHDGFKVTLYEKDNFEGKKWTFTGPLVTCLPSDAKDKTSSMKVVCLNDPNLSNCGTSAIAGAVFESEEEDRRHIGASVGPGDYKKSRMQAMGLKDNDIEFVHVHNGFAITLFEHDNFGGQSITLLGDVSSLGSFKNKASSMKVKCIESLSPFQSDLYVDLNAKRASDMAKLDVSYILNKEVRFIRIEKYDGKLGAFDIFHDFTIDTNEGIYTYYDEHPSPGDNVYRVRVFYTDDTQVETSYQTVRFPWDDLFTIYPNPASDIVNIELESYLGEAVDVVMYDVLGVEVAAQRFAELSAPVVSFDLTNTLGGSYVIRVSSKGKTGVSKKFTIVKP
jgi:Animal haem peroxidase/Secretion system C-terminal sorting domain